jgi:hypothetical protein
MHNFVCFLENWGGCIAHLYHALEGIVEINHFAGD